MNTVFRWFLQWYKTWLERKANGEEFDKELSRKLDAVLFLLED